VPPDVKDVKTVHNRDVQVSITVSVRAPQDVAGKILGQSLHEIASRWDDGISPPDIRDQPGAQP
jgi:hypothetical protein